MSGLPVTVRLLDPPLHEFLPKAEKDIDEVARSLTYRLKKLKIELQNYMKKIQC